MRGGNPINSAYKFLYESVVLDFRTHAQKQHYLTLPQDKVKLVNIISGKELSDSDSTKNENFP